ncbi:HD-GYP domain-containing protein [Desulfopila aestuarii]|uniref:PAS domain S-box-containing protein n=1 Tax=Desulfopila aestuarii DSM 18488 TaxID=1121416 RepID=A0A1M7Y9E4_9BACT|nr:HD domain-containing phosphohydrolase [Desulfopila aestuarii]SHO49237.1 PAS domain S-box-containing protein [Desulfopila aestuarii DSM 18488]
MSQVQQLSSPYIFEETRLLFYQRTLICLWLAVVFFPLFSILDYAYCNEYFSRFLLYRLIYVIILLAFINLLKQQTFKKLAPYLMYLAMVLGSLVISKMAVELGGFSSGYYVGILLMIAGALFVLPLSAATALFYGLSMYGVYLATVLTTLGLPEQNQIHFAVSNSFFFLSLVGIVATQSYDDLHTLHNQLRAKENIRKIHYKLSAYTDGLEETIQQRLIELQETDLKYQDLYNNIMDMVVLVDDEGIIHQFNNNCRTLLGIAEKELEGKNIRQLLRHEREKTDWLTHIILQLRGNLPLRSIQLNLVNILGEPLEVELSASRIEINHAPYFQLILRDISIQKSIERKLLDAERLIGTSRQAAIFGLARLAECRDDETGQHLSRIRSYTRILTEELASSHEYGPLIDDRFIDEIGYSAVLHDIGKVGIPDSILMKPGKLTEVEFELMKQHTIFGANVLAAADHGKENSSFLQLGRDIARSHHERWDSRGYPDGLPGDEIPLAARIISLADVYDALTSNRVYKPPFSHEESRAIIVRESGRQFDPHVVNAFLRRENDFKETRMRLLLQQPEPARNGS